MFGTESEREVTMFPGTIEPETRISAACRVANPGLSVIDMGSIGMSGSVIEMLRRCWILGGLSYRRGSFGGRPAGRELVLAGRVLIGRVLFRLAPLLCGRGRAQGESQGSGYDKTETFHSLDFSATYWLRPAERYSFFECPLRARIFCAVNNASSSACS